VCKNRFCITKAFFEGFRKFCLFAFEEKNPQKYPVESEIVELAKIGFLFGFFIWGLFPQGLMTFRKHKDLGLFLVIMT